MTTQEFIFSNEPRYRITRHATFWFTWWIYFLVTYYYPTFQFTAWNLHENNQLIERFGFLFFLYRTLVISTLLAVLLPQALFTYCIISYALPRYISKENDFLKTTLSFVGLMLLIYAFAIGVMYIPFYHSYKIGMGKKIPAIADTIPFINRTYLFNLPVVAGMAAMIKLIKRWLLKQQETEQMTREKTKAELQLLKAQVHPHFLFNTLNNIYFFTLNTSPQAPEMIRKLTSLLQYILDECNQPLVPVEKEIKMLQDYIDLEKIRYGEQLRISTEMNGSYQNKMIAPLLLIPFVENSFKHGASKMIINPSIKLRISCENNELIFFIANSQPVISIPITANSGIGIKNVKKRLQLLYPGSHELNIVAEKESFTIYLKLKIIESTQPVSTTSKNYTGNVYAMA